MSLLTSYDVLLLDLDGVVYRGPHAVPHAIEVLRAAQLAGVGLGFVTNNASRPAADVAHHLAELGLPCTDDQVVTSAQVGADLLAEQVAPGSRVLAVGGPGVALALAELGYQPVRVAAERQAGRSDVEIADSVRGVLQGFGPDVSWRDLAVASYAVAAGAQWVATNTDLTIPRADGIAPGNGTLVAAVTAATGIVPPAAGKPAAAMMLRAAQRLGAQRALAVGDRLDTDIAGARAAGIDALLVGTGVTAADDLLAAKPGERPTYVAADLRGLTRELPSLDEPATASDLDGEIAAVVQAGWQDPAAADADRLRALLVAAGTST
jgi:glycerol 3-phosphatase-2